MLFFNRNDTVHHERAADGQFGLEVLGVYDRDHDSLRPCHRDHVFHFLVGPYLFLILSGNLCLAISVFAIQ